MSDTWWISARDLKPEQEAVVRIPGQGNFLVTGPPGCGKTNALMLRAQYLNKKNRKNYQIIVFTRALKEFLAACPNPSVPSTKLKTLSGWLMETINTFNGQVSVSDDFDTSRDENVATLEALLDQRDAGALIDTLLLDEVQDFSEREVNLFRRVSREIYAVGDPRQRIYKERGGLAAIRSFCQELPLTNHFRNGQAICKIADHVGGRWDNYVPMLPTSMYKESEMPSSCESARYDDLDAQIEAIKGAIPLQLDLNQAYAGC